MGKCDYTLERRYIGNSEGLVFDFMRAFRDWHKFRSYGNSRSCSTAFKFLSVRDAAKWEYRIAE